jgi:hypothetical protein
MKGNLGKENAGRKWKMEEFPKNFLGGYPPQFVMQTPCRTGLGQPPIFGGRKTGKLGTATYFSPS